MNYKSNTKLKKFQTDYDNGDCFELKHLTVLYIFQCALSNEIKK